MKNRLGLFFAVCIISIACVMSTGKKNVAKEMEVSIGIVNQKDKNNEKIQRSQKSQADSITQEIKKGEEVTFCITVTSSMELGKIEAYLSYDGTMLQFISSGEDAVVGASGTLHILDQIANPVREKSYTITMKALDVGTTQIKIHDAILEDENNADIIEVKTEISEFKNVPNELESEEAELSKLLVYPGKLKQEFHPQNYEYEMEVTSDVNELMLSAIPMDEESIVTINQPDTLIVGKNEIIITVTAPSGTQKTYILHVNKQD